MKCPLCDGGGEVRGFQRLEDDGTMVCPLCKTLGEVTQEEYDRYMAVQAQADKDENDMDEMANMQDFEDRISPPIEEIEQ